MKAFLFPLLLSLSFIGCCKALCVEQVLNTGFVNFEGTDVDTVITRLYNPNTNFSNAVDSASLLFGAATMDTIYIPLSRKIDYTKDIEIFVPSTGNQYYITDIQSRREKCACGQSRRVVTSYKLDGIQHTGEDIFLVRP